MDPEGADIKWDRGTDEGKFDITGGVLTFKDAPNFEMPGDVLHGPTPMTIPNPKIAGDTGRRRRQQRIRHHGEGTETEIRPGRGRQTATLSAMKADHRGSHRRAGARHGDHHLAPAGGNDGDRGRLHRSRPWPGQRCTDPTGTSTSGRCPRYRGRCLKTTITGRTRLEPSNAIMRQLRADWRRSGRVPARQGFTYTTQRASRRAVRHDGLRGTGGRQHIGNAAPIRSNGGFGTRNVKEDSAVDTLVGAPIVASDTNSGRQREADLHHWEATTPSRSR